MTSTPPVLGVTPPEFLRLAGHSLRWRLLGELAKSDRTVHEQWNRSERRGEYLVIAAKRFVVKASGRAGSMAELKAAVAAVNLGAAN